MPRCAPVVADDLRSMRLGPHCFAHLRAVAEGVPVSGDIQYCPPGGAADFLDWLCSEPEELSVLDGAAEAQ